MKQETLAALSAYAHRGWAVFPCKERDKAPATSHGFKDAQSDLAKAMQMFKLVPEPNIGIACEQSELIVIDIDPRNGGSLEIFTKFWAEHGLPLDVLSSVPTVRTGGGGFHLYFHGSPCKSEEFLPGIERKSRGVYVLAPPSLHPSGNPYSWTANANHRPPELPKAATEWTAKPKQSAEATTKTFRKGERRRELFSVLGTARAKGLGEKALLDMVRSVNKNQCEPPVEDHELIRMVGNALKYPGSPPPELVARSYAEICANPTPMPRAIVRHLILENQINMICGAAMTGKSILGLEMAVSIGSGVPVLGQSHFSVPKKRAVTYVYGEQSPSLWELRIRAIAGFRGVSPDLYLVDGAGFVLSKPSHREELLEFMQSVGSDVVFIDPLVVLFPVEDENDAVEVSKAVRGTLQNMVARGYTPIVVHHASKSAAAKEPNSARELVRGSGDLTAMLGGVIGVWSSGQGKRVKVMTAGRLSAIPAFAVRPGDPVSGMGGDALDIEDLALGEDKVEPPVYDGYWEYASGATMPEGEFTVEDAMASWHLNTPQAAHNRITKMIEAGELKEVGRQKTGGRGQPKKTWIRAAGEN